MDIRQAREQYWAICDRIRAYRYALNLSTWDLTTKAPPKGKAAAAKARGILAGDAISIQTSPELQKTLEFLLAHREELTDVEIQDYESQYREIEYMNRIPKTDYQRYTELQTTSAVVWMQAKEKSDFSMLAPYLERLLAFSLRMSALQRPDLHPLDACLDRNERGITRKDLDPFFDSIKDRVIPLLQRIGKQGSSIRQDFLSRRFPIDRQIAVYNRLLESMGFDLEAGLLAYSEHPYCERLVQGDVRLTTHFYEDDLPAGLFSVLHQGGHAVYEQNANKSPLVGGTMLDSGSSKSIYESQCRLCENFIGRSQTFWQFFFPLLQEAFPDQLSDVTDMEYYRAVNVVKPGPIRLTADELTYNLHILVRYELEKDLFEQNIHVDQLPKLWNRKCEEYFGVTPKNDKEGVLQDIQWANGMFGFFPSYALGNAYAAQLFRKMEQSFDLSGVYKRESITDIVQWLDTNVHQYGRFHLPGGILEEATGESLNADYLTDYLVEKYENVYFS